MKALRVLVLALIAVAIYVAIGRWWSVRTDGGYVRCGPFLRPVNHGDYRDEVCTSAFEGVHYWAIGFALAPAAAVWWVVRETSGTAMRLARVRLDNIESAKTLSEAKNAPSAESQTVPPMAGFPSPDSTLWQSLVVAFLYDDVNDYWLFNAINAGPDYFDDEAMFVRGEPIDRFALLSALHRSGWTSYAASTVIVTENGPIERHFLRRRRTHSDHTTLV